MDAIQFTIEYEQEGDGRWIAEVRELPGALVYGPTLKAALALRVIAERLEHDEEVPTWTSISFAEAV